MEDCHVKLHSINTNFIKTTQLKICPFLLLYTVRFLTFIHKKTQSMIINQKGEIGVKKGNIRESYREQVCSHRDGREYHQLPRTETRARHNHLKLS